MKPPLLLGMGSPILSDDGVGLYVCRALSGKVPGVEVAETFLAGLGLLEIITDRPALFVVDAAIVSGKTPGSVFVMEREAGFLHLFSSHGVGFFELLALGKTMDLAMPPLIRIYGVAIEKAVSFSEELTPSLSAKVDEIAWFVRRDIQETLGREGLLAL
ncbi:MAG: hydrogenase maturation protease [Thermodesulfobacteriota bacterium]